MKRIAIFLSGRGSNMEAIRRHASTGILHDCCRIVLVFSQNPKAAGLQLASHAGLPILTLDRLGQGRASFYRQVYARLEPYFIDYIVLAGFMDILPSAFVQNYPRRIINIHPADTALHRGLGAYEWAFRTGRSETTITVHYVDEGVDTGPVIAQMRVDLTGVTTLAEVKNRGLNVEHQLYSRALREVFMGAA